MITFQPEPLDEYCFGMRMWSLDEVWKYVLPLMVVWLLWSRDGAVRHEFELFVFVGRADSAFKRKHLSVRVCACVRDCMCVCVCVCT